MERSFENDTVRQDRISFLSCWTTASSFRQPPSTPCSTVSARYVRPSLLRCRWTNDIKPVPKQFAWAGHANWLFSSYNEEWRRVFLISSRHTERIRGVFATMRYINSRLHLHYKFTICHIYLFFTVWNKTIMNQTVNPSTSSRQLFQALLTPGNNCT